VLELLFSTGLRISELCALSKDTFLLSSSGLKLLVKEKGRKERMLQITTPELLQLVQTYCNAFSKEMKLSKYRNRGPFYSANGGILSLHSLSGGLSTNI